MTGPVEEQLIESNKEITKIAKTLHKGPGEGGEEDKKEEVEDQKEVNINVDFHTGGDEPKAVFSEVKDEAESGRKSVQSVKEKTSRVTYLSNLWGEGAEPQERKTS